jgi:hypothetical protein
VPRRDRPERVDRAYAADGKAARRDESRRETETPIMKIEIFKRGSDFHIVQIKACGNGNDALVGYEKTLEKALLRYVERHFSLMGEKAPLLIVEYGVERVILES